MIDLQKTYGAINRRLYVYHSYPLEPTPYSHAFHDYVADGNFYPTERLGRNKSQWTASAGGAPFAEMVVSTWHDFFDLMYLNVLSPIYNAERLTGGWNALWYCLWWARKRITQIEIHEFSVVILWGNAHNIIL